MQLTAPGNLEGVGALCLLHAQGYVGVELAEEPVAQMAAGHVLALLAGERRVIDNKLHRNGRLTDFLERNGRHMVNGAERVANMDIGNA